MFTERVCIVPCLVRAFPRKAVLFLSAVCSSIGTNTARFLNSSACTLFPFTLLHLILGSIVQLNPFAQNSLIFHDLYPTQDITIASTIVGIAAITGFQFKLLTAGTYSSFNNSSTAWHDCIRQVSTGALSNMENIHTVVSVGLLSITYLHYYLPRQLPMVLDTPLFHTVPQFRAQ